MKNNQYFLSKNKRYHYFINTIVVSSLLLALIGCHSLINESKNDVSVIAKIEDKNSFTAADDSTSTAEGISQVVDANNQFAIELYQQLSKNPKQSDDNVFFSPYSLSTAMAMLYNAAKGETKSQIQKTFHYPPSAILNPNSAALYNQFNKPNSNYELSTVNDLWMQDGLTPTKAYVDTVQRYYGGQVTNLDFEKRPDLSRQTINKTIAKHTKQMIPELLVKGSIETDTTAVLTNAVYFKSEWATPLSLRGGTQPFYNADGTTTDMNFMYSIKHFDYMEDEQVQVVALPYKGNDLSMLIVLPKSEEAATMQKLIANLSSTQISKWTEQLENKEIFLVMPKFKLEESYKMASLLTEMGMPIAFDSRANFSLFNEKLPLTVDSIIHKAVVEVDEKGTVAAAATSMTVVPVSASYNAELIADHSFMFMIKDNKTDAILFLGQVNNPS